MRETMPLWSRPAVNGLAEYYTHAQSILIDAQTENAMSIVRVSCFSLSMDGFGAGPDQSLDDPLGAGGMALHDWMFASHSMGGTEEPGIDDDFIAHGMANVGAWILGRNMFGPVRGPWQDEDWQGWWGDTPPYHCDVFVLTHHPRPRLVMEGGTIFHFVTDGIHVALERARGAAGGRDVRIGGGVSTIRQYLQAGLVDEMHLAVTPVILGRGETLLAGLNLKDCGLREVAYRPSKKAAHCMMSRI